MFLPAVCSVGKKCMEQGFSFHWPTGEAPYFICPNGQKVQCPLRGNVPVFGDRGPLISCPAATSLATDCSKVAPTSVSNGAGFSVNSCPQGHAADGPAGAAEGAGLIEKMANTVPPIPGMEPRQLLKAGWTVIGGNPAAKMAHFPKTFRTPAPKFPRHRIRTTWGFKDEVWSLLEDSVNIDEPIGKYLKGQLRASSQDFLCRMTNLLPTWCSELGSMVDVMELQNVPRNILGYATTSMSLSADHRPKALLGRLSYSTLTAKPDSIQTSTIKESRTTSRSPSVITQGGGGFGSRAPASRVHLRCLRMMTANNTKVMTALRTESQLCCIRRQSTEYNPIQANGAPLKLTRQGGTRNSTIRKRNHCGNQSSSCHQLS